MLGSEESLMKNELQDLIKNHFDIEEAKEEMNLEDLNDESLEEENKLVLYFASSIVI